jgi:hypothetical protein
MRSCCNVAMLIVDTALDPYPAPAMDGDPHGAARCCPPTRETEI